MENKTKIILNRSSEWRNRMRNYRVFINGKEADTIRNGATAEYLVEPGNNDIECKVNWYGSRSFTANLKQGENVYLRVRSGMKLYNLFLLLMMAGFFLLLFYRRNPDKPSWVMPAIYLLLIPAVLYSLYYFTIGRKDYLVVEKDTKNVFA